MTDAARRERLDHALLEVEHARLRPEDWVRVDEVLRRLEDGGGSVDELTSLLFEAKVQSRFSGGRASASLPPTKQTSVLPVVGLVCGGMLFGVGALLGGGVILVGIAALGLFVFGVAFAGSRVAHGRRDLERRPEVDEPVVAQPAPPAVVDRIRRLRS